MQDKEDGYPKTWREWFYFPHLDGWALKWTIWFMALYIFPFIQYPFNPWGFVTKTYVKGWFGVPAFICEAVTLWALVIVSMFFFYFGAKKRGLFETKASNDR